MHEVHLSHYFPWKIVKKIWYILFQICCLFSVLQLLQRILPESYLVILSLSLLSLQFSPSFSLFLSLPIPNSICRKPTNYAPCRRGSALNSLTASGHSVIFSSSSLLSRISPLYSCFSTIFYSFTYSMIIIAIFALRSWCFYDAIIDASSINSSYLKFTIVSRNFCFKIHFSHFFTCWQSWEMCVCVCQIRIRSLFSHFPCQFACHCLISCLSLSVCLSAICHSFSPISLPFLDSH